MSRVPGIVAIYAVMVIACGGVGLFMLIAPARFGNLVYESFMLFPQVRPGIGARSCFCALWVQVCLLSQSDSFCGYFS